LARPAAAAAAARRHRHRHRCRLDRRCRRSLLLPLRAAVGRAWASLASLCSLHSLRSNSTTVLGTGGFAGDRTTLWKLLTAKSTQYEHQHGEGMKPHAVAQNLANTLYGKRFFPYYCWNVLAGLDENGVGVVYSYDPVGNYERVRVSVTGSGESLIQPLLDNQLERQHQALGAKPPPLSIDLTLSDAIDLVKDAFVSAGERDIRTGDSVELCIVTKDGIRMETHALNID